ncbi:hypothetical protein BJF85_15910 [Saccharomonospora sp. CUA-673]|nr:hypothetical protein BJF85_15910 [Saccharomonospora sp. CUA-673]
MSDACCGPGDDREDGDDPVAGPQAPPTPLWRVREFQVAATSGLLVVAGFVLGAFGLDTAAVGLHVLAAAVGGSAFVPAALRGVWRRRIGVGTLMTIALVGALGLGQFAEAAMLAFLFSISEALEDYAFSRTRRGLRALLSLVPDEVTVVRDGRESAIAPGELRVGDTMLVRAGQRIPSDGTVRDGRSAVDMSAITGESIPVEVAPDGEVYAGSINGNGVLVVEATATVADNSLARVVRIVEDASRRKGRRQRIADRISRPLVPGVMALALLVGGIGALLGDPATWVERALVVLVAAAPCALAISVPVTVIAAVGASSRMGVLIKGGAALETLGAVTTVAVDKTGTLTRNAPEVTDVVPESGADERRVLAVAAALEARSEHPLAAAVLAAAPDPEPARDVVGVPGAGLEGRVDGRPARLGHPGWIGPGPCRPRSRAAGERGDRGGRRVRRRGVGGARDPRRTASGGGRDRRRPPAERPPRRDADRRQRPDRGRARRGGGHRPGRGARAVETRGQGPPGRRPGRGQPGPRRDGRRRGQRRAGARDRRRRHRDGRRGNRRRARYRRRRLMGTDLRQLPRAMAHARRARRIMLQNIALSGLIIVVLVPLAAVGALGLAAVVFIHELAEVLVIANGIRAGRISTPPPANAPNGPVAALNATMGLGTPLDEGCRG